MIDLNTVSERLALMRKHRAMLLKLVDNPESYPELMRYDGAIKALECLVSDTRVTA